MSDWRIKYGLIFLAIAIFFNISHYLLFTDSQYIMKFVVAQLGFLPVSVFLVTIVLNQLMARREKQALLKKMNMVVGTFFSEVGTTLLSLINPTSPNKELRNSLLPNVGWTNLDYQKARIVIDSIPLDRSRTKGSFPEFQQFLSAKRDFLLLLLGNPNLLEHDSFTELLWAVFHLAEELEKRTDLQRLSDKDSDHLKGDISRVSGLLLVEWLSYMEHLQDDYPYLFSLAIRTNPFDQDASAAIR